MNRATAEKKLAAAMSKASKRPEPDGYPLSPIDVDETCWLYLEKGGVTVVQEERDHNGKHVATLQSDIPWSTLCDAVDLRRKLTAKT